MYGVGEFVEVSIDVIGEDYAQRVLIHNDISEVNAAINLEDLMKDFDLSSKRGEDVFLGHLLAKHFLDADQGLKSLMSVFGDVDHADHARGDDFPKLISRRWLLSSR